MPFPLLLAAPLLTAALGAGAQAARGKKGKDIWKGAGLGALGGLGFAGLAPALGLGGAAAAGTAGAGAAGAGAAGTAAGAGAAKAGLGATLGKSLAAGAGSAGLQGMLSMLQAQPEANITEFGEIPQMQQPTDPWAMFQELSRLKGGMR